LEYKITKYSQIYGQIKSGEQKSDYYRIRNEWQNYYTRSEVKPFHSLTNMDSKTTFDACKLPFKNEFFDVILDKGTLDSLLKTERTGKYSSAKMLKECCRTLHRHGHLFQITDEDPDVRLLLFENATLFCQMIMSINVVHKNYICVRIYS